MASNNWRVVGVWTNVYISTVKPTWKILKPSPISSASVVFILGLWSDVVLVDKDALLLGSISSSINTLINSCMLPRGGSTLNHVVHIVAKFIV